MVVAWRIVIVFCFLIFSEMLLVASEFDLIAIDSQSLISEDVKCDADYSLISDEKNAEKKRKKHRVLVGTEEWCGYCVKFKDEEVPKLVKAGWTVGTEFDHIEWISQVESERRGYPSIPTFIFMDEEKIVDVRVGFMSANEFSDWFHKLSKRKPLKSSIDDQVRSVHDQDRSDLKRPEVLFSLIGRLS